MPATEAQFTPRSSGFAWLLAACVLLSVRGFAATSDGATHPSVLLDRAELADLQQELSRPGWKRDVYLRRGKAGVMTTGLGVRANAELWVQRTIEIPAHGGHFHNFFCTEGDRLEMPTNQTWVPGPYRCPACGKLYSGERYEAALRRMAHSWLAQAALDLALAGAIETNQAFTAKSAEILLKYSEAYPGPHTSTTAGGMLYQSLDEAMWIIPLAQAYDLVYGSVQPSERRKIEAFLGVAAEGIKRCGTSGNWGSWHLCSVGVVGYAINDPALIQWATDQFRAQVRDQLGDDGLWPESVHTYHYFPLLAFMHFAEAAWHNDTDLYRWEARPGKSLAAMFSAPLDYAYPNLRLPAINDGWFQSFVPPDTYELAWYRLKDPKYAWVLAHGYRKDVASAGVVPDAGGTKRNGLYALLFGKDMPAVDEAAAPGQHPVNFPVLGIAVLRPSPGAMLTFDYGPFLGHGQLDKMGVTLYARDKLWAADYGTPGYGSAILGWYTSTPAHNTILVDGKNQARTKETRARLWLEDKQIQAAQSTTEQAYPGVKHTRTVIGRPKYFVVMDSLQAEAEHTYDFCFHSEGELRVDAGKEQPRRVEPPLAWLTNACAWSAAPSRSGGWQDKGDQLAFVLLASHPLQLMAAECPAESGSRRVSMILGRQVAKTAEFVMVLYPCALAGKLEARTDGQTLTVTLDGKQEAVRLPTEGQPARIIRAGDAL